MLNEIWNETRAAVLEQLRAAYMAEVQRFAETLRPRFESGELRGYTDEDGERDERERRTRFTLSGKPRRGAWRPPLELLEDLCEAHFGLEVNAAETDAAAQEVFQRAYLIRSVSPSDALLTEDVQPIAGQAVVAVTGDVLAIARARGWYKPTADEAPSVEETVWAQEARS